MVLTIDWPAVWKQIEVVSFVEHPIHEEVTEKAVTQKVTQLILQAGEFFDTLSSKDEFTRRDLGLVNFYTHTENPCNRVYSDGKGNHYTLLMVAINKLAELQNQLELAPQTIKIESYITDWKIVKKARDVDQNKEKYKQSMAYLKAIVHRLIESPTVDLNARVVRNGGTHDALHEAIMRKLESIAIKLVQKGGYVNLPPTSEKNDSPPLSYACFHEMHNLAHLLIAKGADIHAQDKEDKTALHHVCQMGLWEDTIQLLFTTSIQQKLAIESALANIPPPLQSLIEEYSGISNFLTHKDHFGHTPLHQLVMEYDLKFNKALLCAKTLLKLGGKKLCDVPDRMGWTPMMLAAIRNRSWMVDLMKGAGAIAPTADQIKAAKAQISGL